MSAIVHGMPFGVGNLEQGIGPLQYAARTVGTPFVGLPDDPQSVLPITVRLRAMALRMNSAFDGPSGPVTVQNRVAGVNVGPPLTASDRTSAYVSFHDGDEFDPEIIIPQVSLANIDTDAPWGLSVSGGIDGMMPVVTWHYEPVDPADFGKSMMGIGAYNLADTGSVTLVGDYPTGLLFGSLKAPWSDFDYISGPSTSWFDTPFEDCQDLKTYRLGTSAGAWGERHMPAAVPWAFDCTWQDLILAVRDPAATVNATFVLRVNRTDRLTIGVTAGQRICYPSDLAPITINRGDRVCWRVTACDGFLNAQIIWTVLRIGDTRSGYGEFGYGEGGYGRIP